jgi:hypothetical protein
VPEFESNEKVVVYIETINNMELPTFGDKQLRCSPETTVIKILEYVSDKLNF